MQLVEHEEVGRSEYNEDKEAYYCVVHYADTGLDINRTEPTLVELQFTVTWAGIADTVDLVTAALQEPDTSTLTWDEGESTASPPTATYFDRSDTRITGVLTYTDVPIDKELTFMFGSAGYTQVKFYPVQVPHAVIIADSLTTGPSASCTGIYEIAQAQPRQVYRPVYMNAESKYLARYGAGAWCIGDDMTSMEAFAASVVTSNQSLDLTVAWPDFGSVKLATPEEVEEAKKTQKSASAAPEGIADGNGERKAPAARFYNGAPDSSPPEAMDEAQKAEVSAAFANADLDCDGVLSKEEADKAGIKLADFGKSEDGVLSKAEFVDGQMPQKKQSKKGQPKSPSKATEQGVASPQKVAEIPIYTMETKPQPVASVVGSTATPNNAVVADFSSDPEQGYKDGAGLLRQESAISGFKKSPTIESFKDSGKKNGLGSFVGTLAVILFFALLGILAFGDSSTECPSTPLKMKSYFLGYAVIAFITFVALVCWLIGLMSGMEILDPEHPHYLERAQMTCGSCLAMAANCFGCIWWILGFAAVIDAHSHEDECEKGTSWYWALFVIGCCCNCGLIGVQYSHAKHVAQNDMLKMVEDVERARRDGTE